MPTEQECKDLAHDLYTNDCRFSPNTCYIGVTKYPLSEDGEFAISAMFKSKPPFRPMPDRINGIKIVYTFDVGEIRLL